jgi:hypothetical protein
MHVSSLVNRFKRLLSAERINALGQEVRFCRRERIITPFRLALSLISAMATMRVQSLADVLRCFNALHGTNVAYKPFHNQLAKWRFGDFMRELVNLMLEQWVVRVLDVRPGEAFAEFHRILIQDGSSFAVKNALAQHYPGRFKSRGPAAVELHVTMDLLNDSVSRVALTPDTFPERPELPEAPTLRGCLLLADRGYFDVGYLKSLKKAEAAFVVRGYTNLNPRVVNAFDSRGQRLPRLEGKSLQEIRLPKRGMLDLDVEWETKGLAGRVVVSWNQAKREYRYLVTNLPRERYDVQQIEAAYRLRWQVELLFKEWKSYANLHAFDTANPGIAEGMIWAAIAASTLKRYMAHMTQHIKQVEISTRKVAMCAHHVLGDLFQRLAQGKSITNNLSAGFEYLAANAKRDHPQRERRTGRLQSGLEPVFGVA